MEILCTDLNCYQTRSCDAAQLNTHHNWNNTNREHITCNNPKFSYAQKCAIRMLKIPSSGTSLISVHPLFQKCFKSPAFIPHILLSTRLFPLISSPLIVHFSNENSMYPFHFPPLPLSTFPSFTSSPDSPSCPSEQATKSRDPNPQKQRNNGYPESGEIGYSKNK